MHQSHYHGLCQGTLKFLSRPETPEGKAWQGARQTHTWSQLIGMPGELLLQLPADIHHLHPLQRPPLVVPVPRVPQLPIGPDLGEEGMHGLARDVHGAGPSPGGRAKAKD